MAIGQKNFPTPAMFHSPDNDHPDAERSKDVARNNRGKFRALKGMEGLQNVSSRGSKT